MNNQYLRGSEWRRWELHLHTPFTKKEDQYIGDTSEEKWDNFYQTINDYVGDGTNPLKSICAIAITDYLSIDNYMKVRDDNKLPACVKLLLPNVELRMQPIARDSPINIHCIFLPEIAEELEDRFFAKLKIVYNDNEYSAARAQLVSFGRAYIGDPKLPKEEAYNKALEQYVITSKSLSDVFKGDPELREKTIIVVSNKSTDGASGTNSHSNYFLGNISQLDATRRSIYQLSDMIYSANPACIKYFLGKGMDDEETVKQKCGSLMPCVHGCDAHTNERIFEPAEKRYCWIKGDPTFEGLKQVLYEPKERVRISSTIPESKRDYHVIDRVEIIGNADFDSQPIYFSENLTCIIGGKSTGKSLLLHNMAYAIDEVQAKKKAETAATNVKQIEEMKVYWRDGQCSDNLNHPRKIVYIPQTYLNRLSDELEETTEIDKIIQDIILQDERASALFGQMADGINALSQLITKTIVDFMQSVSGRNSILESKKEIGDREGIEAEIKKLSEQMEQLSKEHDVTEEDVAKYQIAAEKVRQLGGEIKTLTGEMGAFKRIDSVLQKKDFFHKGIVKFTDRLVSAIEKTQATADAFWLEERKKIIMEIEKALAEAMDSLKEYKSQVEILRPKIEGNEQIKRISNLILDEKERMEKLSKYDIELQKVNEKYDAQMSVLACAFDAFKECHMTYVDGINGNFASSVEDLEFKVQCVFRSGQFTQKLSEILNKKTISRFTDFDLTEITEQDVLDPEKMRSLIEAIITNSSETLQLKGNYHPESALREIFTDWNNIDYVVKMDEDTIEDMSPGKKALVLLRLLISLAESKCPILIDQPEDDLDNRSIFDELIQFIKLKKVDRQIIVATHNANIVLGGDAELVLIANQRGRNSPNKEFRFEYRGGSIENNAPVADENGNVLDGILNQSGIQTHICEILEGGERAFDLRRSKYRFIKP